LSKIGSHIITVFEHQSLFVHKGTPRLEIWQLEALQAYSGDKGCPYYSLIHKGVTFCEFVGVIQIGKTIIEVLPKADKNNDEELWRGILIDMLKAVGIFDIHAPSNANLHLKNNSILDLYFEWFISETEGLLHKGLIKRYHKTEGNSNALKGRLLFGNNIKYNLTHQERFYIQYTVYDKEHPLNSILYKTLNLLQQINSNGLLTSRIGNLLLNFPELPDIKVSDALFEKIQYNRKTESYRKAIDIARLLLLNYHPDIRSGKNDVLALMFNMNLLWEQFVYSSIRKFKKEGNTVTPQANKAFWKPEKGRKSDLRPDIVINKGKVNCRVFDTKWKNVNGSNPSSEDLRQLYTYSKYHQDAPSFLVYPGEANSVSTGIFLDEVNNIETKRKGGVIEIHIKKDIRKWQEEIAVTLLSNL